MVAGAAAIALAAGSLGSGISLAVAGGGPSSATTGSSRSSSSPSRTVPAGSVSMKHLSVSAIASRVDPAVVDISTVLGYEQGRAAGTGMILTSGGQVLTNNHVVEGATSIKVKIAGHSSAYGATVLGTDPSADVALLQVHGISGLPTVSLGNSSTVSVGESVVAIGNALDFQGPPTVTQGIVSALHRSITAGDTATGSTEHLTGLIQTDAPISPGNSGGPLVDPTGQVIGMNTAAVTGAQGQTANNIAFAIPINTARNVVNQIRHGQASQQVHIGQRGILGVQVTTVREARQGAGQPFPFGSASPASIAPVSSGAAVVGVVPGSPAASAGIHAGDVIVSLDGSSITSPNALSSALAGDHPGHTVRVGWVDQAGSHHHATVQLAPGPPA
jgi:S1-C subfamily serine protease